MTHVAIITIADDIHAYAVREQLARRPGVACDIVETDRLPASGLMSWSLDDPAAVPPVSVYGTEARMPFMARIAAQDGPSTEDDSSSIRDIVETIRLTNHQHPDHDTDAWPEGASS